MDEGTSLEKYADQLGVQMRKGLLVYCVLLICDQSPASAPGIITSLRSAGAAVPAGTIYPLLNRLQKDGLLLHEWRESTQGPPRKYYHLSTAGKKVLGHLRHSTTQLQNVITIVEKGVAHEDL